MKIPQKNRDLARYVCRRDLFRILGCVIWAALLIGGALFYNYENRHYPDYRLVLGWRMALWASASVISGVLIFRIPRLLADRAFVGTVIASSLSRDYTPSDDPNGGHDYDFRLKTVLKVRTDRGRLRRIRFEQKPGFYLYYHEGNCIAHFHGLPYPVSTDPDAPHGYVCAACGHHAEEREPLCPSCHHTLIDPREI